MTQTWVESKMRDRVARVVVFSLVIGWSAIATFQMSPQVSAPRSAMITETASLAPQASARTSTAAAEDSRAVEQKRANAIEQKRANAMDRKRGQGATQTSAVAVEPKTTAQKPAIVEAAVAELPVQPNGHLIVAAKEILLTDHRRVRVGELPFRPVKKALINFQKTSAQPSVTLTASADIPELHVNVVRKFMERFYGWRVSTVTTAQAGTFELDVAPASEKISGKGSEGKLQ